MSYHFEELIMSTSTIQSNESTVLKAVIQQYQPSLLVKMLFTAVNIIWVLGIIVACIQLIFLPPLIITLPQLKMFWNNTMQTYPMNLHPEFGIKSWTASIFFYLTSIVVSVIFLWIVWYLRKLIRTIKEGNPFLPENPGRIRKIAYAILVWAPFELMTYGSMYRAFTIQSHIPGGFIQLRPSLEMIFLGLVILVIAEVFKQGVKLQQEQDLTV
jgi:hypothetical protein